MPHKSAFKRSILNVQPAKEVRQRVVPQSLQDRAVTTNTFVEAGDHGFASTIGRQFPVKTDSSDSIPLIAGGIGDSSLAGKTASDPERPELISLSSPFAESIDGIDEVLRLRDFESTLDEADLNLFYADAAESSLSKDIEKRVNEAEKLRNQLDNDLSTLMGMAGSIDRLRDNCSFVNNIMPVHDSSTKFLQALPKRFGNSPETIAIDPNKTFMGISNTGQSSSTSLITLLSYTLLYPGSVRFAVPDIGDSGLTAFITPTVVTDPVNDLLTALTGIDVNDPDGFLQAESLLPQDPMSRIALISEALAYELSLSVGVSRIKSSSVASYITDVLGQSPSVISDPAKSGTILSTLRDGNNLPLEINDITIGGTSYKGILSAYVDGPIAEGTLNFSELDKVTRRIVESLSRLITDIKKLRLLDDTAENLSPMGIITLLAGYIASGVGSLGNDITLERSKHQLAQLLLLRELSTASSSGDLLESRYRSFQAIIASGNTAQTENSDPNAENTQVSTTAEKTSNGGRQGEKTSLKITINGEQKDVQIENTTPNTARTVATSASRVSSISSMTTGGSRQSFRASSSGKTSFTSSQAKSKSGTSSTTSSNTASTSTTSRVGSATQAVSNDQAIYEAFTGKGGSGHLSSTFGTTFESVIQESRTAEVSRNDLFTQFGLSFGVASILGFKDLVSKYLIGENVNVESAINEVASKTIEVIPRVETQTTADDRNKQQETKDTVQPISTSVKQYSAPQRKAESSIAGMPNILSRKSQSTSLFGIPDVPVTKKASIQTNVKKESAEPRSESLFGLSFNSSNVPDNTKSKQNFDTTTNLTSKVKSRTVDDSQSILDMISTVGATSGSTGTSSNTVGKQVTPQSDMSQLNADVRSFLTLFPMTSETTQSNSFGFSMSSIRDTLRLSSSEADILLSGEYRKFVQSLLNTAGELAGDVSAYNEQTSNYGIRRSTIEYLCFSMFISMCSLMGGIQGNASSSASKGDFDVKISYDSQRMLSLWTSINALAVHTGPLMDFVQSSIASSEMSKLVGSLRYADKVGEILKIRYAVLQNFINTYSNAVSAFIASMMTDEVSKTTANIRKTASTGILRDISQEAVSGAQISAAYMRGPLTLDRTTRQVRISKRLTSLLYKTFGVQDSLDSFIATVGIPSKSIETLRRSQKQIAGSMTGNLQEYVEVSFSRQDVQFPDIITRNVAVRFCPRLEAVPTFTSGLTLTDCMKEFTYLCHDGITWKQRTMTEAVQFVMSVTGLSENASYVVVTNHAIDAICKCASYAVGIPGIQEIANTASPPKISPAGAALLLKLMRENSLLPTMMGNLLPGDFLETSQGSYLFKRFSALDPDAIKLTNESKHRLLGLVTEDAAFTYESRYTTANCFNPLERVYSCVIDPDEFVIDKAKTLSTISGKAAFERIVIDGLVDVYDDVAVFKDTANTSLINGAVYAAKVQLVIE